MTKDSKTHKHPELNPEGPLCVAHGCDSFKAIGLPDGRPITDPVAAVRAWRSHFQKIFSQAAIVAPVRPDPTRFAPEEGGSLILKKATQSHGRQIANFACLKHANKNTASMHVPVWHALIFALCAICIMWNCIDCITCSLICSET